MSTPLVSVIIAVRNGARFLAAAINSVLEQDYAPLEIIAVDGQSTDRTAQIAQSYAAVRYVYQENRGVANAYNLGIDAARGEYVAFLSHDDLWTPNKLSTQIGYMLEHPTIQYTVARVKFFCEPGCRVPAGFRMELLDGDHVGRIMETLVARKSLFGIIGKFDPNLTTAEDVDWFARANDREIAMAVLPEILLHKRVHDANISITNAANNQNLLRALRQSIARKRE